MQRPTRLLQLTVMAAWASLECSAASIALQALSRISLLATLRRAGPVSAFLEQDVTVN